METNTRDPSDAAARKVASDGALQGSAGTVRLHCEAEASTLTTPPIRAQTSSAAGPPVPVQVVPVDPVAVTKITRPSEDTA